MNHAKDIIGENVLMEPTVSMNIAVLSSPVASLVMALIFAGNVMIQMVMVNNPELQQEQPRPLTNKIKKENRC